MFFYNLRLALLSLRRNPVLSALMIVAIGLGIGAAMTMFTVYYQMSADPIPQKSSRLYRVQLDNWDPNKPYAPPDQAPAQVTYRDAVNLMNLHPGPMQNAMFRSSTVLQPPDETKPPFRVRVRATYRNFFPMFDTPFEYGGPWGKTADAQAKQVVVLSNDTNERLFGGEDSVGQRIKLYGRYFAVVGVLKPWRPTPRFYDLTSMAFAEPDDVYVPLSLTEPLQMQPGGIMSCWKSAGSDFQSLLNSECVWLQFWVQLDTPAQVAAYKNFLDNYVREQKKLGRFPRPLNNHLRNVMQWLDYARQWLGYAGFGAADNGVLVGLAFMFLVVCLVNMMGLLLAKFLGRAAQSGVRRALGATRAMIFYQHLVEVAVIGIGGGLLGLGLTWLGLRLVSALYRNYERLTQLDPTLAGIAIGIALVSAVIAGVYPAWRICRTSVAMHLKTQ
ncbi:MAG TPA: ABC transporter permease [Gammaproteobacteria bacterium]|nr:ABC transporter permease [Gammaproteobacteria bacterium]